MLYLICHLVQSPLGHGVECSHRKGNSEALSAVLQLLSSLGSRSLVSLFILSIRSWSLVRLTLDQLGQPEFCASLLFTVHVHSLNTVCHLHFGRCSTQLCLEEPTLLAAPNVTKVVYRFFRVGQIRRCEENRRENNNKLQGGAQAQELGSHRTKIIS